MSQPLQNAAKQGPAPHEPAPVQAPDGMLKHLRVSVVATLALAVLVCGVYPLIVWGVAQVIFPDKANGSLLKDKNGQVVGSALIGQSFAASRFFHPRPSAAGNGYDPMASGGSNLGPTSAKLLNGTTKPSTQPAVAAATVEPAAAGSAAASAPTTQPSVVVDYDGIKLRTLLYAQENGIDIADSSVPLKTFMDGKGNYDQVKLITAFNDSQNPLTFRTATPIPADAVTASASGLDPHISPANAMIQVPRVAKARNMSEDDVKAMVAKCIDGPDLGILGESGVNVLRLNLALEQAAPSAVAPAGK